MKKYVCEQKKNNKKKCYVLKKKKNMYMLKMNK